MAFVGGRDPGLASAAPSIATAGGAGGLFLDVGDHNPAQRILDDLANHVQLVVARYGLQVLPVFSANAGVAWITARILPPLLTPRGL